MKRTLRISTWILALALAWAPAASAQNVKTGGAEGLTIRGFLSASMFAQDTSFSIFGNGQNWEIPNPQEATTDQWFLGGDVRNTRVTLAWNGPKAGDVLQPAGVLEIDFFGGFNGVGFASDEQPMLRLRLAYADLVMGSTTLRFGQAWSPWFGNVPVSLSHIAFPLGYGSAGAGGWRFPGVFLLQKLTPADSTTQMLLTVALMRGSWVQPVPTAPADAGATILNGLSSGEASFIPQVEARFDVSTKAWGVYVVGHFDMKDNSGRGATVPTPLPEDKDKLPGIGAEVGARFKAGPLFVHGNAYYGLAMGQQFMHITQFGRIAGWGAWLQAGFDLTPNLGIYAFGGYDDPDEACDPTNPDDVPCPLLGVGARLNNLQLAGMIQYKTGPWATGLEYIYDTVETRTAATTNSADPGETFSGSQIIWSVKYDF